MVASTSSILRPLGVFSLVCFVYNKSCNLLEISLKNYWKLLKVKCSIPCKNGQLIMINNLLLLLFLLFIADVINNKQVLIYFSLNISYIASVSLFYFCYIRFLVLYSVVDFKFLVAD